MEFEKVKDIFLLMNLIFGFLSFIGLFGFFVSPTSTYLNGSHMTYAQGNPIFGSLFAVSSIVLLIIGFFYLISFFLNKLDKKYLILGFLDVVVLFSMFINVIYIPLLITLIIISYVFYLKWIE